jgi:type IV secretion system protein VirD4
MKLIYAILYALISTKLFAIGIGYILYGKIKNYSINLVYKSFQDVDNLNYISQIIIYVSFLVFGILSYKIIRFILLKTTKQSIIDDLHGSARFLTHKEIKNISTLNAKEGVFVGAIEHKGNKHYLRSNGNEHCLILAPTRAGKGVCLVVPTLLTWMHSVIVYDIKRELYHLSKKWRSSETGANNNVYKFDPAESDTHCFNPLAEIRIGTSHQVPDAQNIAIMLVDSMGEGIIGKHWLQTAYTLFTGCILYITNKNHDADGTYGSIPQMLELLCHEQGIHVIMQLLTEFSCKNADAQKVINLIGQQMMSKEEKELSGIVSTTVTQLSLYFDPMVSHAVSKSDFTINDICNSEKPSTLYLVTDPNNKDRFQPLIRLMLNIILRRLTAKMNFEKGNGQSPHKHRLLLLLDEFPSLGYIPILEESISFMAGYGIKAMLIAQDLNQIYAKYKKTESIIANCNIISAFNPNNPDTAAWISKKLGDITIVKHNISVSGKRGDIVQNNSSNSIAEIKRNLMTAEEIMTMPSLKFDKNNKLIDTGNILIMINGQKPIYGKQMPFFIDSDLSGKCGFEK